MYCMLVKPFAIFISALLNTCVFRPLLYGKPLSKPPFSNIRDHHQTSGHPIFPDDFSVLSSCSSSFELLLRKSLLIFKLLQAFT